MISLQSCINNVTYFYNQHKQVKKVGVDFKEQLFNFATQDEKYPIIFIVPDSVMPTDNTTEYTLNIYCYDIIQKDRANIITILSDCHQILNDLYVYYFFGLDNSMDVIGVPTFTALNNDLLDYAAGYQMTITFALNDWTDCAVPI
jgi:predicted P-loop ATPase/GTPase